MIKGRSERQIVGCAGVTGVVAAVATSDYSDPVVMCNEAGGPIINQRDQSDSSFRQ